MRIGVPRETKTDERRVALTPAATGDLVADGHDVAVQAGAGVGAGFPDAAYAAAGARTLTHADDVWDFADFIVKVKEPTPQEYPYLRAGQILFTYLHLAASRELTDALIDSRTTAIAYETVTGPEGGLPLLAPMSEIAGRLAAHAAAHTLFANCGGPGVLISGAAGVPAAHVVVIGAGVAGTNAVAAAVGMGARVTVLDTNATRLLTLSDHYAGRIDTLASSSLAIEEIAATAEVIIGAVLVPGERAPQLLSHDTVTRMRPGSVLVDIAIDQGGCFQDSRPTTHTDPTYPVAGTVFYAVANMPGAVPVTATRALGTATLPYVRRLAALGWERACRTDPGLSAGLAAHDGDLASPQHNTAQTPTDAASLEAVRG